MWFQNCFLVALINITLFMTWAFNTDCDIVCIQLNMAINSSLASFADHHQHHHCLATIHLSPVQFKCHSLPVHCVFVHSEKVVVLRGDSDVFYHFQRCDNDREWQWSSAEFTATGFRSGNNLLSALRAKSVLHRLSRGVSVVQGRPGSHSSWLQADALSVAVSVRQGVSVSLCGYSKANKWRFLKVREFARLLGWNFVLMMLLIYSSTVNTWTAKTCTLAWPHRVER